MPQRTIKGEIKRKAIHLCAMAIPIGYSFLSRRTALPWVVLATVVAVTFDVVKVENRRFRYLIFHFFRDMFRHKESKTFTGSAFITFVSVITILAFNKWVAIIALTYIIVGDVSAAILGRLYGRHKVYGNRTLEGSVAFFATAAAVSAASFWVPYDIVPVYYRIAGALLAALVEMVIVQVDDNLTVPLLTGLMLQYALGSRLG